MKTVKIKFEIEAEVPEGKYCNYRLSECYKKVNEESGNYYVDNTICSLFDKKLEKKQMHKTSGEHEWYYKYFKCQQCLDACKKKQRIKYDEKRKEQTKFR